MNGKGKIISYAVAGVLVSIMIVAAMFVSGIQFPGIGSPAVKIQTGR